MTIPNKTFLFFFILLSCGLLVHLLIVACILESSEKNKISLSPDMFLFYMLTLFIFYTLKRDLSNLMVASWICIFLVHTAFDYCQKRFCKKAHQTNNKKIQVLGRCDHKNVNISLMAFFLLSFFVEVSNTAHICQ